MRNAMEVEEAVAGKRQLRQKALDCIIIRLGFSRRRWDSRDLIFQNWQKPATFSIKNKIK